MTWLDRTPHRLAMQFALALTCAVVLANVYLLVMPWLPDGWQAIKPLHVASLSQQVLPMDP